MEVQTAESKTAAEQLQAKWEQPVHKDWLIGELIVGHFWPRQDAASERTKAWALGAGLKLKF